MRIEFALPDGRYGMLTNEVAYSKHGEPVLVVEGQPEGQTLDAADLLEAGGRTVPAACLVRELLQQEPPAAVRELVEQFVQRGVRPADSVRTAQ